VHRFCVGVNPDSLSARDGLILAGVLLQECYLDWPAAGVHAVDRRDPKMRSVVQALRLGDEVVSISPTNLQRLERMQCKRDTQHCSDTHRSLDSRHRPSVQRPTSLTNDDGVR
jgi:hypothetical protein